MSTAFDPNSHFFVISSLRCCWKQKPQKTSTCRPIMGSGEGGARSPSSHACLRLWSWPPHSCRNCTHTHTHFTHTRLTLHLMEASVHECFTCTDYIYLSCACSVTYALNYDGHLKCLIFQLQRRMRWICTFLQVKFPKPELLSQKVANYNPHDCCLQHIPTAPQTAPIHSAAKNTRVSFFPQALSLCGRNVLNPCHPVSNTNTALICFS